MQPTGREITLTGVALASFIFAFCGANAANLAIDGNKLQGLCKMNHDFCHGFILGTLQVAEDSGEVCQVNTDVTVDDLRRTLLLAIEAIPHGYQNRPAFNYVVGVVNKTYCG